MFKSSALVELQKQIDALKLEGEESAKKLQASAEELTGVKARFDAEVLKVEALTKDKTALTEQLATANKKLEGSILKADFDKKVEDAVIERCAAAGITPIKRDPQAADPTGETFAEKMKAAQAIQNPTEKAKAIDAILNGK